jgi:TPR repeat protein
MLDCVAGLRPESALRRAIRLLDEGKAARGFKLLARAARAGVTEAQFRIGRCYLRGSGVPASRAEGARWLETAATAGHTEAQWLLAAPLIEGVNIPNKRAGCALVFERRRRRTRLCAGRNLGASGS